MVILHAHSRYLAQSVRAHMSFFPVSSRTLHDTGAFVLLFPSVDAFCLVVLIFWWVSFLFGVRFSTN